MGKDWLRVELHLEVIDLEKDNCSLSESLANLLKEERITFKGDDWYPCYFKPISGQIKSHEVLDGLYNPSKEVFKLDPMFNENIKDWNSYLRDHVWFQDNVLEYTLKETK